MKKLLIFTTIALFCLSGIKAQQWMNYLENKDQSPSYFEVEKAFFAYQNDSAVKSRKDIKKYRRWEYFWKNRVDEHGHFPSKTYWQEARKAAAMSSPRTSYANWVEVGPREIPTSVPYDRPGGIGRIDCITFHTSNDSIYWIGTPSGGLWKTTDDGETWENLTDGLPSLGVSDLKVHPEDENTLFLATGTRDTWWETYSVGILKSVDGGYNWIETGLDFDLSYGYQVNEILINPENPDIMLAATNVGIFRSADGSDSWERVNYSNVKDIAFKPNDYNVVYASTFNTNGGARFYKSIDGGLSFGVVQSVGINASQVNRICIGVTDAAPDYIYLLCSSVNNNMYGLFKSTDGGDNWSEPIQDPLLNLIGYNVNGHDEGGYGYYMMGFVVSPENPDILYAGGANIWKSTDGGQNWQNSADWLGRSGIDYVHADQHTFQFNPLTMALYAGCDGGIYKLEPGSDDWQDKSEGLGILQIYRIGLFYIDDNRALLGPQDNGIISMEDDDLKEIWLAEAGDNFYDQSNPEKMFLSGYGMGLCKSINGGVDFVSIQPYGESKLLFNPPFIKHTNEDVIYCAYADVYRSENWGNSWTKIMDNPDNEPRMLTLRVAPSSSDVLYTANSTNIWRTLDSGESWTDITNGLIYGYVVISDITISDQNPMEVWITLGGYQAGRKVYRSTNGGDTWENISFNLPNIPVNCILFEPGSQSSVYIGTDVAVFYFNNDLNEWIYFSDGLPNVIVNELEINPVNRKIKAATFGRGVWESNLMDMTVLNVAKEKKHQFKIFPNPTDGMVHIELSEIPETAILINLIDMKGNAVWKHQMQSREHSFDLQLPQLLNGNYMLQVAYNEHRPSVKQIVISN